MKAQTQRFKVLEFTNASGTASFRVSGIKRSGERIRQNYADLASAQVRQIELETEWLAGHTDIAVRATKLTDAQIRLAEGAFQRLDADDELLSAVDHWLKHGRRNAVKNSVRLDDAAAQFKSWVNTTESLRPTTRKGLKNTVARFSNGTGNLRMDAITPEVLDVYFDDLKTTVSAVTLDSQRRRLSRFFSWCIERPRRWMATNPAHTVKLDMPENGHPPTILTVPECERLMRAAEKFNKGELVPYFATCLFGGLRPDEAKRLTWAQVNFTDGELRLEAGQTKTGRARVIALNAPLRQWLEQYQGRKFFPTDWPRKVAKVKTAAGFGTIHDLKDPERKHLKPWPADVMRHTAISHYFRSCGSYGLTAERHGNSEQIIKAHYQGRVSTEDTKRFYAIMPTTKKGAK